MNFPSKIGVDTELKTLIPYKSFPLAIVMVWGESKGAGTNPPLGGGV